VLVERWHRSRWSIKPGANHTTTLSGALTDVSCLSRTSCTAVGGTVNIVPGTALVEHWDGLAWTLQKPPPQAGASLSAVSCPTRLVCAAVGSFAGIRTQPQALAAVSRNGRWTMARLAPPGAFDSTLSSVSCATATYCMALGYYQPTINSLGIPFAEIWNGTGWARQAIPLPPDEAIVIGSPLSRLSCASTTACVAVGSESLRSSGSNQVTSRPLAEAWNGSTWTIETPAAPPGVGDADLFGVSCTSISVCTAVGGLTVSPTGGRERGVAERRRSGSWSVQTVPTNTGQLNAVSCAAQSRCVAVGVTRGKPLIEQWNENKWSVAPPPPVRRPRTVAGGLEGVSCSAPATCIAVGSGTTEIPGQNPVWHPFFERLS
jgi:hypothetical protein